MNVKKYGAALAVVALVAAGCGNSDEDTAKKSLAKSFESSANTQFKLTSKQANCVADNMVDKVGLSDLKKAGVVDKNNKAANTNITSMKMSKSDADAAADSIVNCTNASELMVKSLQSSAGVDSQTVACMKKALTKSVVKEMFSDLFQGDTAAAQNALKTPLTKCATGS